MIILFMLFYGGLCFTAFTLSFAYMKLMKRNRGNPKKYYLMGAFVLLFIVFGSIFCCFALINNYYYMYNPILILSILFVFHGSFCKIRYYPLFLILFLALILSIPRLLIFLETLEQGEFKAYCFRDFKEHQYFDAISLSPENYRMSVRQDFSSYCRHKDLKDLEVLVPKIVDLRHAFFNSERKIFYISNEAVELDKDSLYMLKCRDILGNKDASYRTPPFREKREKDLREILLGYKLICVESYVPEKTNNLYPIKRRAFYKNILSNHALKNLPKNVSQKLFAYIYVQPYMYEKDSELKAEDVHLITYEVTLKQRHSRRKTCNYYSEFGNYCKYRGLNGNLPRDGLEKVFKLDTKGL
ncbi:MAG: hypothetical protein PHE89_00575 [Alphaproteobacteria bacterium]|nr:hypothetical protein [Alphaproteobacteria bacterium]